MSRTRRFSGWLRHQLAVQVVVHTTGDASIAGVLDEVARDGLILIGAGYLDTGGDADSVPLAGHTFIPREKIAFVQVDPHASNRSAA